MVQIRSLSSQGMFFCFNNEKPVSSEPFVYSLPLLQTCPPLLVYSMVPPYTSWRWIGQPFSLFSKCEAWRPITAKVPNSRGRTGSRPALVLESPGSVLCGMQVLPGPRAPGLVWQSLMVWAFLKGYLPDAPEKIAPNKDDWMSVFLVKIDDLFQECGPVFRHD